MTRRKAYTTVARSFSPMYLAGDTASLARTDQYEFWIEHVLGRGTRWNVERLDPAVGFRGRAHHARVGAILLAENCNDPFRVWRNPARDAMDGEWFSLAVSSVEAVVGERREQRLAPGELVLIDARRPVTLCNERFARVRYMMIPHAAIPFDRYGNDNPPAVRTISRMHPLGRMLYGHFAGLFELVWRTEYPPAETAALTGRQLLELLAVYSYLGESESGALPISDIASARYRDVLNLMRWHCTDPELTPERIAARAGLSRASLYRLFRKHETRFSSELNRFRLDCARELLGAPGQARMSLTEIALNSGFANSSVFSRRFREAFKQAPSEYRRGLRDAS